MGFVEKDVLEGFSLCVVSGVGGAGLKGDALGFRLELLGVLRAVEINLTDLIGSSTVEVEAEELVLITLSSGTLGVPVGRFNLGDLGAAVIGVDWIELDKGGK